MNSVQLVGRLTKDVDLRYTSSGTAVGNFTLAVNRNFKNQQGEREADFIQCVIWRQQAETLANFTRKGSQIGVQGRIQTRSYDNNQGQRVYVTEVVVEQFFFLEPKSVTEQRPAESSTPDFSNNHFESNQNTSNNFDFNNDFSQSSPFLNEGETVDVSEDDLPF
ncbi:single-stranded DNA-binding protein [Dolosicoccus paucivorans]|uniref:Single-stranded DNA-binding protein n=1 Tax=Dolosicoccus paucivorans TaxID=84521 RepID=A0A1G8K6Q6_9LACT|nr:single-stranded DNA-binding protein [Dolosicoccus paucivorans]PMB84730.1 single-stranded DNA-binding protein [Dolosicoccus paucivorans]PMC58800.1 single-stranded DNA-binding protein [Dolosicoccus paucivorans]SDI39124.1 single-strand binding protein [Dolosicoccus paucivorans]